MIAIEQRTIGLILALFYVLIGISGSSSLSVAAEPRESKLINSIGMKLVLIPAGKFMMGSPDSQLEHLKSEKQHEVHITKPFYLGQFEVTQAEYAKVTQLNPSFHKKSDADLEKYPVERISWFDAVAFCEKLSDMPAETKAKRRYRLPTEAEWEYACRAGTTTPYHFGNSLNGDKANILGSDPFGTATAGPNLGATSSVGSYKPNAFELYDMHGNVWEWCSDWYAPDYYADSPKNDPQGPANGVGKIPFRTVRSGGWKYKAAWATSAHRGDHNPKDRKNPSFGVRVVCEILTDAQVAEAKVTTATNHATKSSLSKVDLAKITIETNSIGMKLVAIPAGKFQMGSPPDEKDRQEIEILHDVTISTPFMMGQYEVTQAEYEKLTGKKPSFFSDERVKEKSADFPVEQVSWTEAVEYCKKLSELPEEKAASRKYRLPTEAEWEYACRAGTKTAFYHGSSINGVEANCNGKKPYNTNTSGPNLKRTCTVGKYPPNPFGLYDMHGNVWEWCSDWFDPAYYKNSPAVDPKGPAQGLTNYYVDVQPNPKAAKKGAPKTLRGGSWSNDGGMVRAAFRDEHPEDHFNSIGFRVVCEKSRE